VSGRAVITGAGLVSALGDAPPVVHRALCEGRRGMRTAPELAHGADGAGAVADISYDLQPHFGARNIRPLDRTARLATAAAGLALADSGITAASLPRDDVGIVLGTMFGSVRTITEFDRRAITAGPQYVSPLDFANTVINAAAGQVAIWYGLRGVNSTVAGGHAGAYAIAHAADLVEFGAAGALLAGGAEELCTASLAAFRHAGVLCDTAGDPRPVPFDARRGGFVLGEGAAFVVVEHADSATRRGAVARAHILGHATVCSSARRAAAGGKEIGRAISLALDAAGIAPEDVDCVSASASGSVDADAAEARGLIAALGARAGAVPVTAIKSMLGECLAASGALQVACVLETMRDRVLPGIPGFEAADAGIVLAGVSAASRSVAARVSLVISAWEGTCTALVLGTAGTA
jgi:3-oxoacyl-[acyl-carrier-protein] synthase II